MGREVWLRPNTRVFWSVAALTATLLVITSAAVLLVSSPLVVGLGAVAMVCLAALLVLVGGLAGRPRLAYEQGHLLVYLRASSPIRVPIEIVECFFFGQAPSLMRKGQETATVIVRLAESAEQWKEREVQPLLGQWCEGYVTIRGTWCEPLTRDVLQRLNNRLIQAHREASRGSAKEVG